MGFGQRAWSDQVRWGLKCGAVLRIMPSALLRFSGDYTLIEGLNAEFSTTSAAEFTPDKLNDLRAAVLEGQVVPREVLMAAREAIRHSFTANTARAKTEGDLGSAVASAGDALDF